MDILAEAQMLNNIVEKTTSMMLFGADWEATAIAEYEADDLSTGLVGGFTVIGIVLLGYYNERHLIKFEKPVEVDLDTVDHDELRNLEKVFKDANR